MPNIEQNICDAVSIIVNNAVSNAGFDRTIQGSILSCVSEATGKYKVRYQDSNIYAFTADINKKYSRGTQVYVLVPGNDMSKQKTIIGEVGDIIAYDPDEEYTAGQIIYERSSENLIQLAIRSSFTKEIYETGIYSKTVPNNINYTDSSLSRYEKIFCEYSDNNADINFIDKEIYTDYINESKYLYLGAYFRTNFNEEIITQGNYGLIVKVKCKNPNAGINESQFVIQELILDLQNGIYGNPYSFKNRNYAYAIFEIPQNFEEFISVEIFTQNFTNAVGSELEDSDIFVSDVGLYTANAINDLIGGDGITLSYPSGKSIYKGSDLKELKVSASIIENKKIMNNNQHAFYWFKRDLSVYREGDEGYNRDYGGSGWYCLNNKNSVGWKPASNEFSFSTIKLLLDKRNEFKVVAVRTSGNTEIKYERTFRLYNYNYSYNIDIYSTKYSQLSLNRKVKDLDLVCRIIDINSGEELTNNVVHNNFAFYWYALIDNIQYYGADIINRFSPSTETRTSFPGNGLGTVFPKGGLGPVIQNISLGSVTNGNEGIIFGCTIKKTINEELLPIKTIYVRIGIDEFDTNPYTLSIVNKCQGFTYDEYGKSPFYQNGSPDTLGLSLMNNQSGEYISIEDEIRAGKLEIEWKGPENFDNSLIIVDENYKGSNGISINNKMFYLNYDFLINENYDYKRLTENTITVFIKYKGLILEDHTQFIFTQQGQYGTNGTEYYAKIILKTGQIPNWVTFTTYETYTIEDNEKIFVCDRWIGNTGFGKFNFAYNGEDEYSVPADSYVDFPFSVVLYKNGKPLDDGAIINKKWSMKTLSYGNPERKVESNFILTDDMDGNHSEGIKYNPVLYDHTFENGAIRTRNKNIDNMREYMPANILCCDVTYEIPATENQESKKIHIYNYLPIVRIVNRALDYINSNTVPKIEFDITKGYNQVIYGKDGCNPQYSIVDDIFRIKLDSTMSILRGTFSVTGTNGRTGGISDFGNYTWYPSNNLTLEDLGYDETSSDLIRQVKVTPTYRFIGDSINNGILFRYIDDDLNLDSYIHIPICLHLNLFGMAAFNEWDGISIDINNEKGRINAPQVIAGEKDNDNKFTGIVMGSAKDESQKDLHPGLYSYYKSKKTFGVYADSGYAFFGHQDGGQIVIDPKGSLGCYLYSSEFFSTAAYIDPRETSADIREYGKVSTNALRYANPKIRPSEYNNLYQNHGMFIDMSQGGIYYGSKKFIVDNEGNLTSVGGHFDNGITNNFEKEAYLDLNTDDKITYQYILKFGNKFIIDKTYGAVLSASGHFSNTDGSAFLNFQKENGTYEKPFVTISENGKPVFKVLTNNNLSMRKTSGFVSQEERQLYPANLTGFLLYCAKPNNTNLNDFRDIDNLQFGVSKDGNVFAHKGKIGSFYLDDKYFKTTLEKTPSDEDIVLSKESFKIDNFKVVEFYKDSQNRYIISYKEEEKTINNLRFSIGKNFAVENSGHVYCDRIYSYGLNVGTIDAEDVNCYKIYAKTINTNVIDIHADDFEIVDHNGYTKMKVDSLGGIHCFGIFTDTIYTSSIRYAEGNSSLSLPSNVINTVGYSLPWMSKIPSTSNDILAGVTELPENHIILIYEDT